MGCFLGCFGLSKKRKTRKGCIKIISIDQSYGRYVPLDSDASIKLDRVEKAEGSGTKYSDDRLKETSSSVKTKKKVSFNLNVKAYEPLPPSNDEIDNYLSEGEEKTMWEYQDSVTHTSILHYQDSDSDSVVLRTALYPSNYRYQNWRETCDDDNDEDEVKLEESDQDEDDDDLEWDEDDYDIDSDESDKPEQNPKISAAECDQERKCNQVKLQESLNEQLSKTESARQRNERFSSVLNPVENLSQWKAVKSKPAKQSMNQKENIPSSEQQQQRQTMNSKKLIMEKKSSNPLTSVQTMNSKKLIMHEIAVNASLSNWLV